jgi:hypothetical protein
MYVYLQGRGSWDGWEYSSHPRWRGARVTVQACLQVLLSWYAYVPFFQAVWYL